MARKKKNRNQDKQNMPLKVGKQTLQRVSTYIQNANDYIGKTGDGENNNDTLIAAIEDLNADIHDGTQVTNWFNNLNNTVLPAVLKAMQSIDGGLDSLDFEIIAQEKLRS
jgi:hypothetical protein